MSDRKAARETAKRWQGDGDEAANLAAAFLEVTAELEQERKAREDAEQSHRAQAAEYKFCRERLMIRSGDAESAEQRAAELQARLDRVEAERNAYRSFYIGVSDSFDDTWQCEWCGHAEPWWADCNADYATRDAVLAISAEGAGWQGKGG